jgi:prefoldin alpha subunit
MDEQELQKKYMEYNMIDQKVKQLQEQLQMIEQQLSEIIDTLQSLDELKNLEGDKEILIPVNKGIFIKGILKKEDKLYVNVGSSTVVDKNYDDTKGLIEKQKEELDEIRMKILETVKKLANRAEILEKDLNTAIADNEAKK